jgi:hypothetical protein
MAEVFEEEMSQSYPYAPPFSLTHKWGGFM